MKAKELLRALTREGWELDRIKGSHHVFRHPAAKRPIVVPLHGNDIPEVWAKEILKQARRAIEEG